LISAVPSCSEASWQGAPLLSGVTTVAQPASNGTMMSYKRGEKKKKTTQAVKTTPHHIN